MEEVSMLALRRNAEAIIRRAMQGKRMVLTYRGKPVIRLEPIVEKEIDEQDLFYTIDRLAVDNGKPLTNEQIDKIVYRR